MPLTSIGEPGKLTKSPPQCSSRAIAKTLDMNGTAAAAIAVTKKRRFFTSGEADGKGRWRAACSLRCSCTKKKKKSETDTDRLHRRGFLVLAGGLVFGPPRRDAAECIHVYPAKPGHPCATAENGAETKEFSSPLSSG